MTKDGYLEPDVCQICGEPCYVGKTHKKLLEHVIDRHLFSDGWTAKWKCWCGFESLGYDGRSLLLTHLRPHVGGDLNMTFQYTVDGLWTHYHAEMLGVDPEVKCATSTAKP